MSNATHEKYIEYLVYMFLRYLNCILLFMSY
jgi:hypothetical protein